MAAVLAATLLLPATRAEAAPPNDNLANAAAVTPSVATAGNLDNSTQEPGESDRTGVYGGTVWYAYTPANPVTANLKIVGGPGFYPLAKVFTGTDFSNLEHVTGPSWCPTPDPFPSRGVCDQFEAEAGVTYLIQVYKHNNPFNPADITLTLTESGPGSISGTVTDESDVPLQGICVKSFNDLGLFQSQATTASDGTYTVPAPSGSDRVEFSDCNGTNPVFPEWHNNKSSLATADPITVPAGGNAAIGTTTLQRAARISGTVTANAGGGTSPPVCVTAYDTQSGAQAGSTTTDGNGSYSLLLAADDYKVEYRDCAQMRTYLTEWYADKPDRASATTIALTPGQVFTANAVLALGGTISGSLSFVDPSGENVCIEAHPVTGDGTGPSAVTVVGSNEQSYLLQGLDTGSYRLKMHTCGTSDGPTVWYPLHHSFAFGEAVAVTQGANTSLTLSFGKATAIDVHVQDGGGAKAAGVCVDAYDAEDSSLVLGSATTDANGDAQVSGLAAGNYKVRFGYCNASERFWHQSKDGFATADTVSVSWPVSPSNHPSVNLTAPDITPPDMPTLDSTSPPSGSGENDPKVIGTAEAGSTVQLYTDATCTTPIGASTPAATFASPGIPVDVADNSTTTFYAKATDAANNASACSTASVTYTEYTDVAPPALPTLDSTSPASGADQNNPRVRGTAEPGSTVQLYSNATCTTPVGAPTPAAAFGSPGIAVPVADNSTTTFYAKATDLAGNSSGCSTDSITYAERTPAATAACTAAKAKLAKAIAARKRTVAAVRRAVAADRPRARIAALRRKAAAKKKAVKRARARVRAACS